MRGLGVDVVEVRRFHPLRPLVAKRILSSFERQVFPDQDHHDQWLAGRWAVKEAIIKTGYFRDRPFAWRWVDVRLVTNAGLKVTIYDLNKCQFRPEPQLWVSISHTDQYAVAVAVWS